MTLALQEPPPEIEPLDHFRLYAYLGLVSVMEPDTELLMRELAERMWREDEHDSPHDRPWFVSFHASQFPGSPENACKRYLLYRMMNLPSDGPMPPWVTTTGDVGKAGELSIARAWFAGGRSLAVPEDHPAGTHQLGFRHPGSWMTASTDLPILKPGWRRPHIVEIKGKADEVVEEMLTGYFDTRLSRRVQRGPDESHVIQLKASLGLAHDYDWGWVSVCARCWFITAADIFERQTGSSCHPLSDSSGWCPRCKEYGPGTAFKLEPPTTGEVYYWSRSWPRKTKSFFYEHEPHFMQRGLQVLSESRAHFLDDELPPRPPSFQWSIGPCKNCSQKPVCRLDEGLETSRKRKPTRAAIVKLSESYGIAKAQEIRPNYDYAQIREAVLSEWKEDG